MQPKNGKEIVKLINELKNIADFKLEPIMCNESQGEYVYTKEYESNILKQLENKAKEIQDYIKKNIKQILSDYKY